MKLLLFLGLSISVATSFADDLKQAKRSIAQNQSPPTPCGIFWCKGNGKALAILDKNNIPLCYYTAAVTEVYSSTKPILFPADPNRYLMTTWNIPGTPGSLIFRIIDMDKVQDNTCEIWSDENHPEGYFIGMSGGDYTLPKEADKIRGFKAKDDLDIQVIRPKPGHSSVQIIKRSTCAINSEKVLECVDYESMGYPVDNPSDPQNQ